MRFPKSVNVAPHRMSILYDDDNRLKELDDLNGLCDFDTGRIWIDRQQTPLMERDTVLHEVLHAIFDQTGVKRRFKDVDKEFEEDVVVELAPRILQVLRDNPRLVEYLTS